jgi:uncharacterized delta-60 repeat protein
MKTRSASHRPAARKSAAKVSCAVIPWIESLESRRFLSAVIQGSTGIVLQSSGKPVVLDFDANKHAVLERYFANSNVLDPTFGAAGEVDTNLDAITDIARGPGDKIVIVGSRVIARFNADGSIDTSFGPGSGQVSVASEQIEAVTTQPDGKVVVAAVPAAVPSGAGVIVQRFNTDGTPDLSFAADGTLAIQSPGTANYLSYDVIVESSGKVAVVGGFQQPGSNLQTPFIYQITPSGAVDGTAFNTPAVQGRYDAVAQAPDGGLIAAGGEGSNSLLVRYLPSGQTAFVADLPGQNSHSLPTLNSVAVTSGGNRIVVAGVAANVGNPLDTSDFYYQRYDLSGNLDPFFADHGTGFVSGIGNDSGGYLALAPDGSFYLAGSSSTPPGQSAPQKFQADLFHIGTDGQPVRQGRIYRQLKASHAT